ncbi:hypothetical protein DL89DRAFT_268738 [Linderina pennispora]|uniref:Uncharacterized protein n=1 Tax=Linderina pennispora TaxID=61395 RepID=A0A1Y1W437_9FUNG|nr:uncharacterized protein DL89DRAFT_268738 [Linderina pennispora]ORX68227.1 hypothetical protein DL89DRAFT_268738 [Linderina pennispora]
MAQRKPCCSHVVQHWHWSVGRKPLISKEGRGACAAQKNPWLGGIKLPAAFLKRPPGRSVKARKIIVVLGKFSRTPSSL